MTQDTARTDELAKRLADHLDATLDAFRRALDHHIANLEAVREAARSSEQALEAFRAVRAAEESARQALEDLRANIPTDPTPDNPAPVTVAPLELADPFGACGHMLDAATREAWPGPRGPWSKWDYLPGLQGLYHGAPRHEPRYPMETHRQQFLDDVHYLATSPKGQSWLSNIENAAVTDANFCRHYIGKAARRMPNGELYWTL